MQAGALVRCDATMPWLAWRWPGGGKRHGACTWNVLDHTHAVPSPMPAQSSPVVLLHCVLRWCTAITCANMLVKACSPSPPCGQPEPAVQAAAARRQVHPVTPHCLCSSTSTLAPQVWLCLSGHPFGKLPWGCKASRGSTARDGDRQQRGREGLVHLGPPRKIQL
eukprot:362980-Chlamydomonas_euryale.AAC.6